MSRGAAILVLLTLSSGCRALVTFDRDRIVRPVEGRVDGGGVDAGPRDASIDATTVDASTAPDTSIADARTGDARSRPDASLRECDSSADCDDGDPCTDDYCDIQFCRYYTFADGSACALDDDGCTADVCIGGECVAGGPIDCDDSASCTTESCISLDPLAWTCDRTFDHASCDDSDPCTSDECVASLGCRSTSLGRLGIVGDGSGPGTVTFPALVISEVAPSSHVELYNTTGADIALAPSTYQLCSPFDYVDLSVWAPSVVVPSLGYATVPWPGTFSDDGFRGELLLYATASFADSTQILDFLCWGIGVRATRQGQAEAVGKWSGGCAAELGAGAIHRLVGTGGTSAFDYDTTRPPSPANGCVP